MTHLTFGVTSLLFLDTQVQRQVKGDNQNHFPKAAAVVLTTSHVDDCLMGTGILENAVVLREELSKLLRTMPVELKEIDHHQVTSAPADCHKREGIHWSTPDCTFVSLHIVTSYSDSENAPRKKYLISNIATTFDVMGCFAIAKIKAKIILQRTTTNVTLIMAKSRVVTFVLSIRWCLYHVKTPIFLAGSMFRPAKPSQTKKNRVEVR